MSGYQDSELRYLTFLYTCPLTVLWGAEQAGLADGPVEEATSLTIHLVGARTAEIRHLVGWEIIALRYKYIHTILNFTKIYIWLKVTQAKKVAHCLHWR